MTSRGHQVSSQDDLWVELIATFSFLISFLMLLEKSGSLNVRSHGVAFLMDYWFVGVPALKKFMP